jgi:hypothetical protein
MRGGDSRGIRRVCIAILHHMGTTAEHQQRIAIEYGGVTPAVARSSTRGIWATLVEHAPVRKHTSRGRGNQRGRRGEDKVCEGAK